VLPQMLNFNRFSGFRAFVVDILPTWERNICAISFSMTVDGTCGHNTVSSLHELTQLLQSTRNGDFGEFWLGSETFPALAIHINGNFAYLHFFPADRHPGFQPVGDAEGEDVKFQQEGQGEFSMPRAFVVSVEQAYQAAAEFFTASHLPGCIKWTELYNARGSAINGRHRL
jgi:hypothetical protein